MEVMTKMFFVGMPRSMAFPKCTPESLVVTGTSNVVVGFQQMMPPFVQSPPQRPSHGTVALPVPDGKRATDTDPTPGLVEL